jgi:hypothetical protein
VCREDPSKRHALAATNNADDRDGQAVPVIGDRVATPERGGPDALSHIVPPNSALRKGRQALSERENPRNLVTRDINTCVSFDVLEEVGQVLDRVAGKQDRRSH